MVAQSAAASYSCDCKDTIRHPETDLFAAESKVLSCLLLVPFGSGRRYVNCFVP